jgi:diguanylate cyclase (GGDEF)-like protein/putative nucleotidyltransferase with HDIG domain
VIFCLVSLLVVLGGFCISRRFASWLALIVGSIEITIALALTYNSHRESEQIACANAELQKRLDRIHDEMGVLERTNIRLEALATTDGLTGLKNHRSFQDRLREEFERAQRYGAGLSVMLLDVDKFKAYNDKFGHPAGDVVLKQVAGILRATARTTDIVARYGGEEFVVILPETDTEDARAVAERYRQAIESASWPQREVTASFGVASLAPAIASASELVAEADVALYRSKQRGRNCVTHAVDYNGLPLWSREAPLWYEELFQQLLASQTETLQSASQHIRETLTRAFEQTIEGWSLMLDMRDQATQGHSKRVATLTERLARSVGLNESEVLYIRWGALLHDIGKVAVPDHILQKPGPLTAAEMRIVQQHPVLGYQMLAPIIFLQSAVDIPYCHHERWDGTGYPQGLKEDEIPLAARLFAVVDVYDALRSGRPYRKPWSEARVLQYLTSGAGTLFDPRAVDAFMTLLQEEQSQDRASQEQAIQAEKTQPLRDKPALKIA